MELEDWGDRWRDGQIGFHQGDVNALLARHADAVWGAERPRRLLVPLCGKSLDMVYLADVADEVVGVEYVEQAVQEFFSERRLDPQVDPGPPIRYRADRYTLYAADVFTVGVGELGPIDAVFDRAAMVALDEPTRAAYARHLAELTAPGARMLLITFDYDQARMPGPPFAVSTDEVARCYGDTFDIEELSARDALDDRFRERGAEAITERALLLTRRA